MNKKTLKPYTPKVSIIIPCYNYGNYLAEAVESCVDQTWVHTEIIIVNDGSTDNTKFVAQTLIDKYPEKTIKLIDQKNMGLPISRNNAVAMSTGDYILPLDADDIFEPQMCEQCVNLLETEPEVSIAYTACRYFGDVDKIADWIRPWDYRSLCKKDILCYASMYRRDLWERIGGYSPGMSGGYEDWEFWIRAGRNGFSGKLIPEPFFLHRIHGHTMYDRAFLRDIELKSKIVINNQACYSQETILWATEVEKTGVTEYIKQNFVWEIATD